MYDYPLISFAFAASGVGVLYALFLLFLLSRKSSAPGLEREIAQDIQAGVARVARREYLIAGLVAAVIAAILGNELGPWVLGGFAASAVLAALAAYFGSAVALRANLSAAGDAALAARGGSAIGIMTISLALGSLAGLLWCIRVEAPGVDAIPGLLGLGLGGLVISLALSIAGGRFVRGMQPSGPQASGIEAQIGLHIESSALAADVFATYLLTLAAGVWLAQNAYGQASSWVEFPLMMAGIALAASLLGSLLAPVGRTPRLIGMLYLGGMIALLAAGGAAYFASAWFLGLPGLSGTFDLLTLSAIIAIGLGLLPVIAVITEYYTAKGFAPARRVAKAAEAGVAPNVLAGLSAGMRATPLPLLTVGAALGSAFYLGGGFGGDPAKGIFSIAIAIIALVSMAGTVGALHGFGWIARGASGIVSLAAPLGQGSQKLDNAGHVLQSVARGYVLTVAALASLLWLVAYSRSFALPLSMDLASLLTPLSLLAGGLLPIWFSGGLLNGLSLDTPPQAPELVPGYPAGAGYHPDSRGAATSRLRLRRALSAAYQTLRLALIPLVLTVALGLLLGRQALAGWLLGSLVVGLLQAMTLTNGGGVLTSARRRIEEGRSGGLRSDAHYASMAGDQVGEPLKGALGPALAAMLNSLLLTALLIAPLLV